MVPGDMDVQVRQRIDIGVDHPAFAGHFPGRPMLPGVALVAEAMEAAAADPALARAIGPAPRLSVVKFLEPVGPGASLEITLRLEARMVAFSIGGGGRIVASGQFARADLDPATAR
jgi:3-hydroxymyristoyl/3-hydroxydecanoyl-(acyl carrier protein) dehydratase